MIHISRRNDITGVKATLIKLLAIVLSLVVCAAVIMATTSDNPISIFKALFTGAFGSERKAWNFLQKTAVLLLISLAVTPAFKMRCWNLGAEGQVLVGAIATSACMICLADKVPGPLLYVLMILTAVVAGAIWAAIPAFFKAKWNTNETLFTLMMNYVAIQLTSFFVKIWENPKGSNTVGIINQNSQAGWLPQVYNKFLLVILVALVMTAIIYIYMNYSKHGYEIAVVGESERTARYIGIHVETIIVRTMVLSGAICGLTGFLMVSGIDHTLSSTLVGGQGFTAVMVSWMSKFNPVVMILSSALLKFMDAGASNIATTFGLNESLGDVMTGIIIFFIIGSEFFINYKINIFHKVKEDKANV